MKRCNRRNLSLTAVLLGAVMKLYPSLVSVRSSSGSNLLQSIVLIPPLTRSNCFFAKGGMRTMDWSKFEPEDDLTETKDGYSFITAPSNTAIKDKLRLLHLFMDNE